jgi:hypothetical protein
MSMKLLPLKHEESGPYAELASRPNPQGFLIAFMPALGAWLQRAEKQKGADLSATEVARIRDEAPADALSERRGRETSPSFS